MGSYAPRFTQCSTVALLPWEHSAVFGDRFSLSRRGGGHWHLGETGRRMSRHTQGGPHTQDCLAQDVAGAAAACDTRVTTSRAAGVGAATADSGLQWPPLPATRGRGSAFRQSFLQNPSPAGGSPPPVHLQGHAEGIARSSTGSLSITVVTHGYSGHSMYTPFRLDSQINRLYPSSSFRLCFQGTQAGNPARLCCKSD